MSQTQKEIERPLGQIARKARRTGGGLPVGTRHLGAGGRCGRRRFGVDRPAREAVPDHSRRRGVAPRRPSSRRHRRPMPGPGRQSRPAPAQAGRRSEDHPGRAEDKPANGVVVIRDPSAVGQNLRVAHLPDRALIEDSDSGPLPIRSIDGRRPMDVYARPWSGARGARIAIVIGGLGLSQTGTQEAIGKLPGEVTLGFSSQGNSLGRWMQAARQSGHEIVMQVPLEPFDYPNVDPGRNTLTVDGTAEENLKNLRWALSRTTNYTGVMNYMGARFSSDPPPCSRCSPKSPSAGCSISTTAPLRAARRPIWR